VAAVLYEEALGCLASMTKELRPLSREHEGEREDTTARGARW